MGVALTIIFNAKHSEVKAKSTEVKGVRKGEIAPYAIRLSPLLTHYRLNPTDATFKSIYRESLPWLRSVAVATLTKYRIACVESYLDDLVNEGAYELGRSARGFVYYCPECSAAFVYERGLRSHLVSEHRLRGPLSSVKLATFCTISARLAITRTAIKCRSVEFPTDTIPESVDATAELRVLLSILVASAQSKLSARAYSALCELAVGDARVSHFPPRVVSEVRNHFSGIHLS